MVIGMIHLNQLTQFGVGSSKFHRDENLGLGQTKGQFSALYCLDHLRRRLSVRCMACLLRYPETQSPVHRDWHPLTLAVHVQIK